MYAHFMMHCPETCQYNPAIHSQAGAIPAPTVWEFQWEGQGSPEKIWLAICTNMQFLT